MKEKIYLSKTDKKIAGVAGGMGEYFDIDPTFIRLAFIFISLITAIFPMILAYIIAWLIIPRQKSGEVRTSEPLDFGSGYNQPNR